jgi:hypothetical protein
LIIVPSGWNWQQDVPGDVAVGDRTCGQVIARAVTALGWAQQKPSARTAWSAAGLVARDRLPVHTGLLKEGSPELRGESFPAG